MKMPAGVIVVFEARPRWAPELERQFHGEGVRIRACRSLDDVARLLSHVVERIEAPQRAVAIIDLAAAAAESLQFLGRFNLQSRSWPIIVIGSIQTSNLEWPVRELGILEWLLDTVPGEELARLCRRQLQTANTTTR